MKSFFIFLLLAILICDNELQAQGVGINDNMALPDTSAMLDIESTTKGFLPPRMTAAQRDLIALPANGLIVYQTDGVTGLYVNKGITTTPNWVLIGPALSLASPAFLFNTDQSVGNASFIGTGTSSTSFIRNTIVVPATCVLRSIVFSVKDIVAIPLISATVWIKPVGGLPIATSLTASILFGSGSYTGSATGNIPVNAGDLVSVQLIYSGGILSNGVAVTVTYQ